MGFSFLVCLREGVEMALIVAILLGYLRTIGQKQYFKSIWMGVGVAAAICIAIGVALEIASHEMDKRIVEAFEGFAMIFAVIVLTGMALSIEPSAKILARDKVLYEGPLAVHLLALELLLVWFPMGKLMHAVLFAFSRGATGIRFGHRGVRV